jgi:para-nitrobenzyl esterase
MRIRVIIWAHLILALFVPGLVMADPLRIDGGQIAGRASDDGAVRIYEGIPYVRPPVGDLRWRAPQPPAAWSGVRQTVGFGANCMQLDQAPGDSLFNALFYTPTGPKSEDCLYLNVWTTARPGGPKQPVMVWIPGGGFRAGSAAGEIYDGAALARQGVTVVSINYRVWKFGFLAHPQLTAESGHHASGNYGLMDQLAALRWVRRNIAAFGGNPAQVTIFGQSAGSYSVSYLVASPLAKGQFVRAIGESGAGFAPDAFGSVLGHTLQPLADAEQAGERLAQALGASSIAELRGKSAEEVMNAPPAVRNELSWAIQDGYVLPDSVAHIYAKGRQNNVPLLTGTNSDEGSLFPSQHTLAAYLARAHENFGPRFDDFLKLYPAHDDATARAASEAAFRDALAGWSNWRWAHAQAEAHAQSGKAPVWYYYFSRHPPAPPDEVFTENLGARVGAYHGAELAYVFGNFYPTGWAWSPDDRRFSQVMSRYWVNFARTGNPNGPGLPEWPAFDARRPRQMVFDQTMRMAPVAHQPLYDFWDIYASDWQAR